MKPGWMERILKKLGGELSESESQGIHRLENVGNGAVLGVD